MLIDDLKQQIKDTPISRIIGHYIPLTKRGNQTLALCPFHKDTKPSLNVNDSKGMFMCFACNTGGDHITFVQKYKNKEFLDSLEEICGIIGLDFEDFREKKDKNPDLEMARKILNKAIKIYQKVATNCEEFESFLKSRGLSKETSDLFKLGYAPSNNIFSSYLQSIKNEENRTYAIKIALQLKIIHHDKKRIGAYFDAFRNRIMFPIFDSYNNPMGFTSRATQSGQQPKYLNSSESLAFVKKRLLYGSNIAKNKIRDKDQLILCEGNMDVIALHQKGFDNSVAIMGTAFNSSLIPIIKSLSKNIVLALDSDDAGREASKRISSLLHKEGILPKFVSFLPQKDPDEYLIHNSTVDLKKKIDDAKVFIDIELDTIIKTVKPSSIEQRIKAVKMATELLSPLGKTVYRTEKIAEFANSIGIKSSPEELLNEFSKNEINKKIERNNIKPTLKDRDKGVSTYNHVSEKPFLSKSMSLAIREILRNPEIMELELWGEMLDLLSPNEVKMWFTAIQKLYFEVDDLDFNSMVMDVLNKDNVSTEFKSIVGAALYSSGGNNAPLDDKGRNQLLTDLINKIKREQLIETRQTLFKRHKTAPVKEQEEILREINNIQIKIKNIN